ncbi:MULTISPECIES: hypothetical protein [Oceanimonas]|uniref:hypothetical protein n=1 Tax=Oceanimonas TaxID=129577 RepID=UPI0013F68E77|nr:MULTISPECIES: hypothetical protein [Oceanimonas]NHH99797.1 hypothetical protein [Oceanimonas sp. MB9]
MTTRQEKERRRLQRRKNLDRRARIRWEPEKDPLDRRERGGRREDDITGPKWLK